MKQVPIRRVCAWRGADMGETMFSLPDSIEATSAVTHGICDECAATWREALRKKREQDRNGTDN